MKLRKDVSLVALRAASSEAMPESRLVIDGRSTRVLLEAAILEAVVATKHGLLVFATADIPYEDQLEVTLIGPDDVVRDRVVLGMPYGTGVFSHLELLSDEKLAFTFFVDERWTLELLDRPRFAIPRLSEPRGATRTGRFRRWFTLSRVPTSRRAE